MTYGVQTKCQQCGTTQIIEIPLEHYSRYLGGRPAAEAMPDTPANHRHLLHHKTCPTQCVPWKNTTP